MNTRDIFESMDYGPAPESSAEALQWLADRGGVAGHFIGGKWGPLRDDFASNNPATGEKLAGVTKGKPDEVAKAVAAARKLGAHEMIIEADPGAAPFYERMGSRRAGEVPSGSVAGRVLPRYRHPL